MSVSDSEIIEKPEKGPLCTPARRFSRPFSHPKNTSKIKTGADRNPIANTAQQTPVH
jgi:hypothetical protein